MKLHIFTKSCHRPTSKIMSNFIKDLKSHFSVIKIGRIFPFFLLTIFDEDTNQL